MELLEKAKRRILNFREKIQALPWWRKGLLLVVALALPAGILLATILFVLWKGRKK